MAKRKRQKSSSTDAINPTALSIDQVARALTAAGPEKISAEQVRADIEAGAPVNRDGTMNLLHYAAWLAQQDVGA